MSRSKEQGSEVTAAVVGAAAGASGVAPELEEPQLQGNAARIEELRSAMKSDIPAFERSVISSITGRTVYASVSEHADHAEDVAEWVYSVLRYSAMSDEDDKALKKVEHEIEGWWESAGSAISAHADDKGITMGARLSTVGAEQEGLKVAASMEGWVNTLEYAEEHREPIVELAKSLPESEAGLMTQMRMGDLHEVVRLADHDGLSKYLASAANFQSQPPFRQYLYDALEDKLK